MKKLLLMSAFIAVAVIVLLVAVLLFVTPIVVITGEANISYGLGALYFVTGCIFEALLVSIAGWILDKL